MILPGDIESMYAAYGADNAQAGGYELGQEFTPTIDGYVIGLKFYRYLGATATSRTCHLWNVATQTSLVDVVTAETQVTGWRIVDIPPTLIRAGVMYVVSFGGVDNFAGSRSQDPAPSDADHLIAGKSRYAEAIGDFPDQWPAQGWFFADIVFTGMTPTLTVTPATNPREPNILVIDGLAAGQALTLVRELADGRRETIPGQIIADGSGTAGYRDRLYPLDVSIRYLVYDPSAAALQALLATGAWLPGVPSGGQPWLTEIRFPDALNEPVWIVDISDRTYAGRVTPYSVVGQKFQITAGDVRSGSNGTLALYCPTHAIRNRLLSVMGTGNPCRLRIPEMCRDIIDPMTFTPVDISESRFGTSGKCVLDVDFIEVSDVDLPAFQATTYAMQTANAIAIGNMTYADLTREFVGETYKELYLSPDGIAWSAGAGP